jgi:hypothetical protein
MTELQITDMLVYILRPNHLDYATM